jgi:transcriptional regulator with XRE-family HTH domain
MNAEREKKTEAKPTGRRYVSVEDLLNHEAVAPTVRAKMAELDHQTRVVQNLVEMRQLAGLTQQQLAEKLDKSQSAISKLESGCDLDLTLRELAEYANVTNQPFGLNFGKPLNHVEAVKLHAYGIREHLEALAKMAHKDEEIEKAIQGFYSEAFFNILTILSKCQQGLPNGGKNATVRFHLLSTASQLKPAPKPQELVTV